MHNEIDVQFYNLMEFIKERDIKQIEKAIKQNFLYLRNKEPLTYNSITNYYNKYKMWGLIDLDNNTYDLIKNNAESLVNHRKDFEWLYKKLGDYRSKKILTTVLYYWLTLDYKRVGKLIDNNFNQYFDLDLIKCNKNEVIVDVGSYIGDSIIDYTKVYGKNNYKKFYCYEIVPSNIDYIKKNIKKFDLDNIIIKQKGASDKKGFMSLDEDGVSSTATLLKKGKLKIKTVRIDEDIKDKVTFIKMDIEGDEEKALLGCHNTILKDHPKLALASYHDNNHLWKLAKIIHNIDPSYKFYLRYYGSEILPLEYILYAI